MVLMYFLIGFFGYMAVDSAWNIASTLCIRHKLRIERERYQQERADFENRAAKR